MVLTSGASATDYSGDLVVASTDTRNNETITIDGSVIVTTSGALDWQDVVLEFNSTGNPGYGLHIDGGVSFVRVTVRTVPGADPYWFLVNSTASMSMEASDVTGTAGSGADPGGSGTAAGTDFSSLRGGIVVASSQVVIGNSTIHDGDGALITILGASPRIVRNTIHSAGFLEYMLSSSFSSGTQTSTWRAVAACVVSIGGNPDMDTNRVERCGLDGSANATDLGSMGAWNAVSNLYLVSAGFVGLGGEPGLRLHTSTDIGQVASPTKSFQLPGPVNVTQNYLRITSWGVLLKNTGDVVVSGGWSRNAVVGFEAYMDSALVGTAPTLDIGPFTVNGTFVAGLRFTATGVSQGFAIVLAQVSVAGGTGPSISAMFGTISAAHSLTLASSSIGPSPAGATGLYLQDTSSSGRPTVTVHHTTMSEVSGPVTLRFVGMGSGASASVHNNSFSRTSGVFNSSCCSGSITTRGAVDIQGLSFSSGSLSALIEDNRIYNQTWTQAGAQMYPGVTLYHQGSVAGVGSSFTVVRNDISNISHGVHIYENFGSAPLNSTYVFKNNRLSIIDGFGLYVQDYSQLGTVDPNIDDIVFDRPGADFSNGYGIYWIVSTASMVTRDFTNITVHGNNTRTTYAMYFNYQQPSPLWTFNLRNVVLTNLTGSRGLFFYHSTVSIYNSDLLAADTAITAQECSIRVVDSKIYPLSATVTTNGDVTAFQMFGASRVQWQGDGGMLIPTGNLYLQWRGQFSVLTLMTIPFVGARVDNTSVPMWKRTVSGGDEYANVTPLYRQGAVDLPGPIIPFTSPYYGNVTILDPELPTLTYTTPAPNSFIRARSVTVKGNVFDMTTGVAGVQVSTDGTNFTNVTLDSQTGAWETAVTFPSDGRFDITLHAWDRARWAITFGNYSSGFREVKIGGIVIDTIAPQIYFNTPVTDLTQNTSSVTVVGQVLEDNPGTFRATFNGQPITDYQLQQGGIFSMMITNLKEGPNQISVISTDLAGNTFVASRTVTVDTIPPHLVILSPVNGSSTNRAVVTIQGEVEAGVVLKVNNVNVTLPYPMPLNSGTNVITIVAIDQGQNRATVVRVVTLDTTAPTVRFTEPSRFPFDTNTPRVVLSATANEPLKSVTLNGISYPLTTPTTFTVEIYLDDGTHALVLSITDLANNTAEVVPAPVIRVDTVAPSLLIDRPEEGAVLNDRTITICGRTDSNAGLNVSESDHRYQISLLNPLTGEFCFEETRTADGTFHYTFEATDAVGNVASVTRTVIIDKVAPEIQVFAVGTNYETDDPFVQLRGQVSPSVSLTVNGTPIAVSCNPSDPSGLCDFNMLVPVDEGQSTLTLLATDEAGNTQVKTINVLRRPVEAPPQADFGLPLVMGGVAAGLALFVLFWIRTTAAAAAANPGLGGKKEEAKRKKREERMKAARPEPEVIYEVDSQAMYRDDYHGKPPR